MVVHLCGELKLVLAKYPANLKTDLCAMLCELPSTEFQWPGLTKFGSNMAGNDQIIIS